MRDQLRQLLNFSLACAQLALPPLFFASGFESGAANTPFAAERNPATPAGYAFAVWAAIYVGALAYAIIQLLPKNRQDPLFRAIGWHTIIGYASCCIWLYSARFGPVWVTVPTIVIMLISLGRAYVLATDYFYAERTAARLITVSALALYVGWLTAATFVNAADVLPGYGFERFGLDVEGYALLTVSLAGLSASLFAVRTKAFPLYIGTVIWALVAIIVANNGFTAGGSISILCASAIAALVVLSVLYRAKRQNSVQPISSI